MRTVKTVLLTVVAGLAFSGATLAQPADQPAYRPGSGGKYTDGHHKGMHHGKGDAGKRMERLVEKLELSEEQRADIREIHRAGEEESRSLHRQMRDNKRAEREALKAGADEAELLELARKTAETRVALMLRHREMQEKVQAVLTEEQRTELEQLKAEREARRREQREKWQQKRRDAAPE